jgi:pyridoxal phosphate enzyme (YggS family)
MSEKNDVKNGENSAQEARLHSIQQRIAAAARRVGRKPEDVILVGASKTVPTEKLHGYLAAGLLHSGENYVQEGVAKVTTLRPQFSAVRWHLIGALQSNKAREVVAHFDYVHSVDRTSLADALNKAARAQGKVQQILLQVKLGDEETKSGCDAGDLEVLLAHCRNLPHIKVCGLMSLPPFCEDLEEARGYFRELRQLRDKLAQGEAWHLSMGMSHDFEVAIEEGATMVRIGSELFGKRISK